MPHKKTRYFTIGKTVGNFTVLSLLSTSFFSRNYLGIHNFLGYKVFIKQPIFKTDESLRVFERESENLYKLSKIKNIPDYYDSSDKYLAMEWLEGNNLKRFIESKDITWQKAVEMTIDLCRIVEAIHDENIIHRDIKPANIMLVNGTLVIVDLGISVSTNEDLTFESPAGSPGYCAIEQFRNTLYRRAIPQTDVNGVGACLYSMITKDISKDRSDLGTIFLLERDTFLFTEHRRRGKLHPINCPENLKEIIYRSTTFYPEDRFSSVKELRLALENL